MRGTPGNTRVKFAAWRNGAVAEERITPLEPVEMKELVPIRSGR